MRIKQLDAKNRHKGGKNHFPLHHLGFDSANQNIFKTVITGRKIEDWERTDIQNTSDWWAFPFPALFRTDFESDLWQRWEKKFFSYELTALCVW